MKYLIIVALFINVLFGVEKTLNELRQEFYDEVVELPVYLKHYERYIDAACKKSDIKCQIDLIKKMKNNKAVQSNKKIPKDIFRFLSRTYTSPEYIAEIKQKLLEQLEDKDLKDHEFISTIDLTRQIFLIFLYDKQNNDFHKIGVDFISSGNKEKEGIINWGDDHFFDTPTGVFSISQGWRSEGKYKTYQNETYQPYGSADRFIYHVGKIRTTRYHVFDKYKQKINDKDDWLVIKDTIDFALHSHNSDAPFGQPYSHGCIRMSDSLNYFLDTNAILHKRFFRDDKWRLRFTKKPDELKYKEYAGEYVVIFDKI